MRSYRNKEFSSSVPCVVALGCFDGVHIGHRAVISKAVELAKEKNISSAVWTFEEPPKNYFKPDSTKILTDYEEKKRLIKALGIDFFICVPFDKDICETPAKDFFESILIKKLHAVHIVCGFDYTFGKNGEGNTKILKELCDRNNIGLTCIAPVTVNNAEVSSSAVRAEIRHGNTLVAKELLGRYYSIKSKVINGQKLATTLGFPTLNQAFENNVAVPAHGVYITRVTLGRKKYFGITNVGIRPTVDGSHLCAETNIFNFEGNLYGKTVKVEFLDYLRPEVQFSSVDILALRVSADIDLAKDIIRRKYGKKI